MTPFQIADDAIALFLELRDVHGWSEEQARTAAALETAEGAEFPAEELEARWTIASKE